MNAKCLKVALFIAISSSGLQAQSLIAYTWQPTAAPSPNNQPLTILQFATCISAVGAANGYGTTCQLNTSASQGVSAFLVPPAANIPPGYAYPNSSNAGLVVGRSGLVIKGTGSGSFRTNTRLLRAQGGSNPFSTFYPLLYVPASITVDISDMTVDGGRNYIPSMRCWSLVGWSYSDVLFEPTATGHIDNVLLTNAPGSALWLTNGYIMNSQVEHARSTGIYLDGAATALSNYIFYNGTAGINVRNSGKVYWNWFLQNRAEMTDGIGGGQLYLEVGSSGASFAENYIDGAGYLAYNGSSYNGCTITTADGTPQGVTGIEGRGSNHVIYNNEIINNSGNGLTMTGSFNVTYNGEDPIQPGNPLKFVENNVGFGLFFHSAEGENQSLTIIRPRSLNNTLAGVFLPKLTTGVGYGFDSHGLRSACLSTTATSGWHGFDPYPPFGAGNPQPTVTYPTPDMTQIVTTKAACTY